MKDLFLLLEILLSTQSRINVIAISLIVVDKFPLNPSNLIIHFFIGKCLLESFNFTIL